MIFTQKLEANGTTKNISRLRRSAASVAVLAAAGGLLVGTANPASARVYEARAAISCEAGRVKAHVPAPGYTRSNYARVRLDTLAQLYRYNPSTRQWNYVTQSGWWAYTVTGNDGRPTQMWPYTIWAVTSNNSTAMFMPFNVTQGYHYAVKTFIYDRADGQTTYVWNSLDVSNPGSGSSCVA